MWPVYVLLGLIGFFALNWIWQDWLSRRNRERSKSEYTAALLRQQREDNDRARSRQEALFNSMLEGVLLLDAQDRIVLVNASLRKFFQIPAEVAGESWEVFKWPELGPVLALIKKDRTVTGLELLLEGDTKRCLQVNASTVMDRDQKTEGCLLVFHDLTRQKELESVRQEFVANVSHELRTPLSLIKGFAETLLGGAKDNPDVSNRFLQKINTHSDRLLFLIEDLLVVSRLESGQATLNPQTVCVRDVAERVIEDLNAPAAKRQTVFENAISPAVEAWADSEKLQQVFYNLLENAIKYGPQNGTITLGQNDPGNGQLQIFVKDNGPGIPPEAIDRIFERFYRVDRARSRETGGTGLGLAIVKHIVAAHGGQVWVESKLDHGSTFYFTIPREPPQGEVIL
jgi:two-component system phosphate regulon sensor histidine kinase PhoR